MLHATENLNADEKRGVAVALMQSLEFLPSEVKIKSARSQGCDKEYKYNL